MSFRFLHNKILKSMAVIIGCISWLIKVTYNNDARWKPETLNTNLYVTVYAFPDSPFTYQSSDSSNIALYLEMT